MVQLGGSQLVQISEPPPHIHFAHLRLQCSESESLFANDKFLSRVQISEDVA